MSETPRAIAADLVTHKIRRSMVPIKIARIHCLLEEVVGLFRRGGYFASTCWFFFFSIVERRRHLQEAAMSAEGKNVRLP